MSDKDIIELICWIIGIILAWPAGWYTFALIDYLFPKLFGPRPEDSLKPKEESEKPKSPDNKEEINDYLFGFQIPNSPVMEGILNFHHDLFFFLLAICVFVFFMIVCTILRYNCKTQPKPIIVVHAPVLEIVWTIVPALILVLVAIPSFSLLYSIDELLQPWFTLKVVAHQWYWSYELFNPKHFFDFWYAVNENLMTKILYNQNTVPAEGSEMHQNIFYAPGLNFKEITCSFDSYLILNEISSAEFETALIEFIDTKFPDGDHLLTETLRRTPHFEEYGVRSFIKNKYFGRSLLDFTKPLGIESYFVMGYDTAGYNEIVEDHWLVDWTPTQAVFWKQLWNWDLETTIYLNEFELDPRLLTVDNKILLPIETNIRVLLTAGDVLHAWAIPALGVKLDACPGRLNQTSLYINRPGNLYGQCSEICGINHGFMPIGMYGMDLLGNDQKTDENLTEIIKPMLNYLVTTYYFNA